MQPVGIEPTSTGLQSAAMTTSAKVALIGLHGRIRTYSLLTPDQAVYQIDITQRLNLERATGIEPASFGLEGQTYSSNNPHSLVDSNRLELLPFPVDRFSKPACALHTTIHKFGGDRGNRTLLVTMLARQRRNPLLPPLMKPTGGIEPLRLLHYVRKRMPTLVPISFINGTPGRIRTSDSLVRSQVL